MKKLLIGTAVVALGFGLAAPASAQVKLDLAGHFKGYTTWVDQDTSADDPATAAIESEDELAAMTEEHKRADALAALLKGEITTFMKRRTDGTCN